MEAMIDGLKDQAREIVIWFYDLNDWQFLTAVCVFGLVVGLLIFLALDEFYEWSPGMYDE